MKLLMNRVLSCFVFLLITTVVVSQEVPKYDYLEIIVVQKANNSGRVKRIKVQEQKSLEGKQITIKEIEDLEGTSDLLYYMNAANWEFIDRQSVVSEENDPVWMSYIFRKRR
ncbi:hypothetical protein SAMN04487910_1422 [Aquimarina amphilecti]|uniref:Uncharacterized protein n=1 Tax=Aquimarina amphilecti TaxID=1038014 RepID=A0A1H7KSX3_AQUAM|nr:hypothetical protein [Aquimarina amphilecti]SEK89858.1 hypothetical protein SAMN04487910_1422 [Aquimarina amphilecti]